MTGASLVPVMVKVTGWVEMAPLLSVTVTLYLTVGVWRTARKSKALSAALNVEVNDPGPEPVLAVTVGGSGPADNGASPLGSSTPLCDQVAEVTLVLTVCWSLRSTSVKASVAVVLRPSAAVCGPGESAASTGASLLPVMVIVTGWVKLAPVLSVTVTL